MFSKFVALKQVNNRPSKQLKAVSFSLKVRVLIFMIVLSLVCYGLVALLPHYTSIDATTPLDLAIPFIPVFIIFYVLLYAVPIPFLTVFSSDKKLIRAVTGHAIIMVIGMICFIVIPIEFVKHITYDGTIFSTLTKMIHSADTNFNNFPSLHVACTLYLWLVVLYERKKLGLFLAPFAWGIIISVLFVKQHLLIDLIGGLILGSVIFVWYISSKNIVGEKVVGKILRT